MRPLRSLTVTNGLALQGYFFTDIVVFYLVPLLLSCVLYGLIARVLFTGHFNKYPEVCRHDNQSSLDPTKSSRVQVRGQRFCSMRNLCVPSDLKPPFSYCFSLFKIQVTLR